MSRFLAGFALGSLFWGGFVYSYTRGWIDISLEPPAPPDEQQSGTEAAGTDRTGKASRSRRGKTSAHKPHGAARSEPGTSGDDLGENAARTVEMGSAGGEEQLAGTEIEKGFDSVFPQVRRCLILAASDEPAHGKLVFGLRISGEGKVTAVNLTGPTSVTGGDAGACLRKAALAIHFRTFHGPEMVVHYPLTLE